MIPKVIHYCWFGGNPLPKLAKKCIKSWKKYCPDYEIIRWDESNFDVSAAPLYVRQAYEAKKWAFVTDYVRLKLVYDHGGIYLDTDVELIKPLDSLLNHKAYFGFEDEINVATGLGFGAEKSAPILAEMMADYADIPFILEDGSYDYTACPVRNTGILVKHGLVQNGQYQELDGFVVYPKDVFCPVSYYNGRLYQTNQTVSIHWFTASWKSEQYLVERIKKRKEIRKNERKEYISYLPNRILHKLLGNEKYTKLKRFLTKIDKESE